MSNNHSHGTSKSTLTTQKTLLSLITSSLTHQKTQQKLFILTGPPNTGKSHLISSLKSQNTTFPTTDISSTELQNIKSLYTHLRSTVLLKIKETKTVYEGEITELTQDSTTFITLKTQKGSKRISLSKSIDLGNITVGDIIYVESNTGIVKKLGRSESLFQDVDLESERYVSLPKIDVVRRRDIVQEIRLSDLDSGHDRFLGNVFNGDNSNTFLSNSEFNYDICDRIDDIVNEYLNNGNCEILKGMLIIRDCEILTEKMLAFLEFYSGSSFAPVIVLCSDKDFDRKKWVKIRTIEYEDEEIESIVKLRKEYLNSECCIEEILDIAREKGLDAAFVKMEEYI